MWGDMCKGEICKKSNKPRQIMLVVTGCVVNWVTTFYTRSTSRLLQLLQLQLPLLLLYTSITSSTKRSNIYVHHLSQQLGQHTSRDALALESKTVNFLHPLDDESGVSLSNTPRSTHTAPSSTHTRRCPD